MKERKRINDFLFGNTSFSFSFLLERMEKVHHHSNRSGNTANTLNDSDHSDIGYDDEMVYIFILDNDDDGRDGRTQQEWGLGVQE